MVGERAREDTARVVSDLTLERVRRDIDALAHAGLDTATFLDEALTSLQRAVPCDAACVASIDPLTRLATGAFKFGALADREDTDVLWGELEYGNVEPTSFAELARSGVKAVAMHQATSGDTARSRRVRELVESSLGCTDELRVIACDGEDLWGGVALFRAGRHTPYAENEVRFATGLSGLIARGLRVGILARAAAHPPAGAAVAAPAVMVFDIEGRLQQTSTAPGPLPGDVGGSVGGPPPAVVSSLVAAARRYAAGATDVLPSSRVRLSCGEWVVLHASPLSGVDGITSSIVVTVNRARPPEIVPLIVAGFDLTPREREVTQLVLEGLDTRMISARLHLSPHTVQDHLKSIFDKTGVRTRRELVARIFFEQYAPRIGEPLDPSGRFRDLG
jgi:DNA-binding CsgD family transcriptional regulator